MTSLPRPLCPVNIDTLPSSHTAPLLRPRTLSARRSPAPGLSQVVSRCWDPPAPDLQMSQSFASIQCLLAGFPWSPHFKFRPPTTLSSPPRRGAISVARVPSRRTSFRIRSFTACRPCVSRPAGRGQAIFPHYHFPSTGETAEHIHPTRSVKQLSNKRMDLKGG